MSQPLNAIRTVAAVAVLGTLVFPGDARAREAYSTQVPNGAGQCEFCHLDPNGGGERNRFGLTIADNLAVDVVDWASACPVDSDNDGYTNGVELGDPNCVWVTGDDNPDFEFTLPGNSAATPCGNGAIDPTTDGPETCDSELSLLPDVTCTSVTEGMFPVGTVDCAADCTYDTTGCSAESATNNANNGSTNNGTDGTNSSNNAANNANTNNANSDGDSGAPTNGATDSGEEVGMACDGALDVEEGAGDSAIAIIGLLVMAALRRRD